jgi:hypothetical protein
MRSLVIPILLVAGCTVGAPTTSTGGGDGSADVDAGTSGTMADGGSAATCTGAVYDPCTDGSQCQSGTCKLFQQAGIQVCTQSCTPGDNSTCPDLDGQPAQCNNMGICKPPGARSCTR